MTPPRRLAALAAAALAAGCAPRLLPGTEIRETPNTRAIYDVIASYGAAMQRRDAAAVLALVSKDYFDDAGTPDPADDLDYAALERTLPEDLARLESLRLTLTLRDIEVNDGKAKAHVFFDDWARIQTPNGPVAKHEADVHRMTFEKVGGAWKIASGL